MKKSIKYKFHSFRSRLRTIAGTGGFTLIEIMVGLAIVSLIMVMAYSSYRSVLKAVRISTGRAEHYENINLAMAKINSDFSNAYFTKNNKNIHFVSEMEGENSVLNFVAINTSSFSPGVNMKKTNPRGNIREVGYFVDEYDEQELRGLYRLMKREDIHFDEEPLEGGPENKLLDHVVSCKFEFRQGNDWTDSWDSRQNKRYPRSVKTTLVVKNYDNKEEKFEFVSLINLKVVR
jgi:type II secretion system protein J